MASKSKLIQAILGRLAVPAPTRSGGKARVEPHLGPSNTPGPVHTLPGEARASFLADPQFTGVDAQGNVTPGPQNRAEFDAATEAFDERMLGPTPQRPPPPPVPDRPTESFRGIQIRKPLEEIGLDHDQLSPNGVPLGADVSRRHVLNKASDEQFSEVMGLEQAILAKNRSAQADIDSIFTSTTEVEDALVQLRSLHEIPREGSVRDLATQLDELGIDRGVIKDVNKRQGVLGLRKLLNEHEAKSSHIDNNRLLDEVAAENLVTDSPPGTVGSVSRADIDNAPEFTNTPEDLAQAQEHLSALKQQMGGSLDPELSHQIDVLESEIAQRGHGMRFNKRGEPDLGEENRFPPNDMDDLPKSDGDQPMGQQQIDALVAEGAPENRLSNAIRELEAEMGPRVGQPQSFPSDNPSQGLPPTQDPVVLGQQPAANPLTTAASLRKRIQEETGITDFNLNIESSTGNEAAEIKALSDMLDTILQAKAKSSPIDTPF